MKKLLVLLLSSTLCFNNAFLTVQALEDDPVPNEEPTEEIVEGNASETSEEIDNANSESPEEVQEEPAETSEDTETAKEVTEEVSESSEDAPAEEVVPEEDSKSVDNTDEEEQVQEGNEIIPASEPAPIEEPVIDSEKEEDVITDEFDNEDIKEVTDVIEEKEEESLILTASSGTCGDACTYTLSDTGVLTISGSGAMKNSAYPNYAPWYDDRKSITKIVVNDGITIIGSYAFYQCSKVTSVSIPDSVTTIMGSAFSDCTGLKEITIPNSWTITGLHSFYRCTGLKTAGPIGSDTNIQIEFRETITSIYQNSNLFDNLTRITIPNSVTSIGNNAFDGCTHLTNITIPDSVTSIGDRAFADCTGLTGISIPNSVTSIGGGAFAGCTGLTGISIPNSVTSIGSTAFHGCTRLTEITIPDSVTSIGDTAFYNCTNLTEITIPDSVTSIGESVFQGCTRLTKITIPNSVTSIGRSAFYNCTGLKEITIPDSVTSIRDFAFSGCKSLTEITIPDSVTSIRGYAFSGCTGLNKIFFVGTEEEWEDLKTNGISSTGNDALLSLTPEFISPFWEITFNNNGGSGSMDAQRIDRGSTAALSENEFENTQSETLTVSYDINYEEGTDPDEESVTKVTSYPFIGWAASASGEKVYDDKAPITPTSNMTLYAKWNIIPDINTETVTLPPVSRQGYTLEGWYQNEACTGESVGTGGESYAPDESETLYAKWNKNSYTITWKNDDGSLIDTTTVEYGEVPEHTDPTKEATAQYEYTFTGWNPALTKVTGEAIYTATYSESLRNYKVTWKNDDGSLIDTTTVEYGETPVPPADPAKEATDQYEYTFTGWDPAVTAVTGEAIYTAKYSETLRNYKVTWKDWDGTELEVDESIPYGSAPSYDSEIPSRPNTAQHTYSFAGWDPSVDPQTTRITGDTAYTATYNQTVNHYTITWKNWDGTVLETDEAVEYGVTPEYNGNTPEKEGDAQYSYTFIGWDPEVAEVTGNTEYKATFSGNIKSYSIKWLDDNGEEIKTETVEYGETPVPPADPTKEATDQYEYTFTGWDPAVTAVTDEAIYTAKYSETLRNYTVTWKNWDGTVLKTEKSDYGSTPKYTGSTPERAEDETYTYTFKGWTPDISEVTGDAEYTASYNRKEKIIRVIGVSLNKTKVTLEKTKTITLTATVKPDNATNKSVFWISSNPSVATVDQNGKITALKKGTAVITALSSADTTKKGECTVTVTVPVSGVKLDKTALTLNKGKTSTLTTTITPTDATNKNVLWICTDSKVATVDSNGKVTAKGAGTATITVKTADGGKTATCKVTVTVPVSGVKLNKTSLTLDKGKTSTLTATVSPSDASNKKVTWKSSNTKVATVDTKGKVTAKAAGTANITVTTTDGKKTATCKVTVKKPKPEPTKDPAACKTNGFCHYNGKDYWYENGVRQGTSKDPQGVIGDGTVRGREVYDGETGAWYWLDAAYDGAKAVGKEVWMPYIYQDEASWKNDTAKMNNIVKAINSYSEGGGPTSDMGEQVRKAILNGDGKWVRYDENGKMMKGWVTINTPELIKLYPGQEGNTYFYDYTTGLMAKGWTTIGGTRYYFDETSGVLQQ